MSKNTVYNNKIRINWTDEDLIGGVTYKSDLTNGDLELGACLCNSITFKIKKPIADVMAYKNKTVFWDHKFIGSPFSKVIGKYIITDIKEINKNTTEVVAYDGMIAFDKIVDDWLDSLTFPISLSAFTDSLITYCAHPEFGASRIYYGNNETFMIQDNFKTIGITGRQILQYIAQVCGGMCFYNLDSPRCYLYIQPFGFNTLPIADIKDMAVYTPDNYKSAEISDEAILPVNKLIVRVSDDDVGVEAGTGDNIMVVQDNPLLYTQSPSEIQTVVTNMYNQIKDVSYYTGKVDAFYFTDNYPSSFRGDVCGYYIKVNDKLMLMTSVQIDDTGVHIQSTGDYKRRNHDSPLNSQITALRGKTNQLTIDIEHTNSTLTDRMNGLESSVNQTASELTTRIENTEGDVSTLTQTVNGFDTRITNAQGDATTAIQTAKGLTLTSSAGSDGKSASIILQAGGTEQSKADIQFNGLVGFNDLSGDGGTEINGNNITSGTISADRIDVKNIAASKLQGEYIAIQNDSKPPQEIGHLKVVNDSQGEFQNELIINSKGLLGLELENELRIGTTSQWDFSYVPSYRNYDPSFSFGGDVTPDKTRSNRYLGDDSHLWDSVWASTDVIQTSDKNQKNSISYDIAKYDSFFDKLKPVKFRLNNGTSGRYHIGMIAQDVEQALIDSGIDPSEFAGFVKYVDKDTGEDGYALRYGEFIALCINKIQALEARIASLERKQVRG